MSNTEGQIKIKTGH